jgi:4-hydroxyproline epimerase
MCGHGTIGTVTISIEEGLINPKKNGRLLLETPAGIVRADYNSEAGKVKSVKLVNVPSFLHSTGIKVECSGLGELTIDVSFGGNFYAIIDQQENFRGLEHYHADQLISWARMIRTQLNKKYEFVHPVDKFIKGCSHVLWAGSVIDPLSTARNAVCYGEKAIDRSPCGTGTSARMAQWHSKGMLKKGEPFIHESIIGSKFTGIIEEEVMVNEHPAIIPSIEGWAKIYGYNTISIDRSDDPYAWGFQVI